MHLLTNKQMAKADNYAIQNQISGVHLMRRAGQFVAQSVEQMNYGPCNIMIIAGPGNNGGDAFVAAKLLKQRGYQIDLFTFGEPYATKSDAAEMATLFDGETKPINTLKTEDIQKADIIIDGLFGTGLNRPISGELAEVIKKLNNKEKVIISIDIPSGINGDTGQIQGVAVKATNTVSFFRSKPGHNLYPGRHHSGELTIHDIGIPKRVLNTLSPKFSLNTPSIWNKASSNIKQTIHKYHHGTVLIMLGSRGMSGATVLAANAAHRAGAGRTIIASKDTDQINQINTYAAIISSEQPNPNQIQEFIKNQKISTILIGPGWPANEETRAMCLNLLNTGTKIVMDAGAISCFESHEQKLFDAIQANNQNREVILTPHEGEFSRLFGNISSNGKLQATLEAAKQSEAIIIHKGPDTVIANNEGRAVINTNGSRALATAGTGDVLAGMVAAFFAKRLEAFEAACAAVYIHAECANTIAKPLIADDLIEEISNQRKYHSSLA